MDHNNIPSVVLLDLMNCQDFGVEYQPIVDTNTGHIHAYEALARFHDRGGRPLAPDRVFRAFHDSPLSLFDLEYKVKRGQIRQAPPGVPVFLNIDLDAFAAFDHEEGNPLLALFAGRDDLVVEIIENCSVADARISQAMLRTFRDRGVPLALDDVGARDTLVSFDVLAGVDYIKLARDWTQRRHEADFAALLRAICGFARHTGKRLIFEGVETTEELDAARLFGAHFVQGFLYRDRFVRHRPQLVEAA
ncbi:MAG: EAL domain-containing protein [Bacteroidota bacterium]